MNSIQQANYDFIIADYFFRSIDEFSRLWTSTWNLNIERFITTNKIFSEMHLVKALGKGSTGQAYKNSNDQTIKFYYASLGIDPHNGAKFKDSPEIDQEIFRRDSDKTFSGNISIRDRVIFDEGSLGLYHIEGAETKLFYVVMPLLIPISEISYKFSSDEWLEILAALKIVRDIVVMQFLKKVERLSETDAVNDAGEYAMRAGEAVTNLKSSSLAQKYYQLQPNFLLRSAIKRIQPLNSYRPELKTNIFINHLFLSMKELVERDNNRYALVDTLPRNIGLMIQNPSVPVIFDY